ncbi:uncharacterized protein [Dipodomys merriami]|uniref:uncharacterized protein n=1 Tax=Dipodomys merriami TaxID=94247 RepID=UPI003855709C
MKAFCAGKIFRCSPGMRRSTGTAFSNCESTDGKSPSVFTVHLHHSLILPPRSPLPRFAVSLLPTLTGVVSEGLTEAAGLLGHPLLQRLLAQAEVAQGGHGEAPLFAPGVAVALQWCPGHAHCLPDLLPVLPPEPRPPTSQGPLSSGHRPQPIGETVRPVWGLMDKCYPAPAQASPQTTAPKEEEAQNDTTPQEETDSVSQEEGQEKKMIQQEVAVHPSGKMADPMLLFYQDAFLRISDTESRSSKLS